MKLKSNLAALANPRVLLALSLCVVGILFGVSALTSFARPAANSDKKAGKSGSAMARKQTERSRASKETDRTGGGVQARKAEKATVSQERAPQITEQQNALGQTVY